jgi:hypothetical protein
MNKTFLKKEITSMYDLLENSMTSKDIENLFFDIEATAWEYAHKRTSILNENFNYIYYKALEYLKEYIKVFKNN